MCHAQGKRPGHIHKRAESTRRGPASTRCGHRQDTPGRARFHPPLSLTAVGHSQDSGEKVAKIIKAIDEIAFQTNILALNAAVEAARAGEAGTGFAVVADEVRNLAGRSAEAARKSSELIQESVRRSDEGRETVRKSQVAGARTTELGKRVAALADELSRATAEQSHGIVKIEQALGKIEKTVGGTAATAQESASACKQLNGQAEGMRHLAIELQELVTGS